jgi:Cu+-exporting ATPase
MEREESFGLQDYSRGEPETATSRDPVCGMTVNEADAPGGHSRYAGETFYFCSELCRKTFDLDPGKYLGQRASL